MFSPDTYIIAPHETKCIGLGFGIELPDGYMANIYPKSSLSSKGIIAQLPPIDSGYRGEIHAIITNTTNNQFIININNKIGQLVVIPIILPEYVDILNNNRKKGAFGSTGI